MSSCCTPSTCISPNCNHPWASRSGRCWKTCCNTAPPVHGRRPGTWRDATLRLVVPRAGTISPWSSKATDIAHNCGLEQVSRLERGVAWYFHLPAALSPDQRAALDALVHDRMTESVLDSLDLAGQLFRHAAPTPMSVVDVLGGGREALAAADRNLGLALAE